MNAEAGFLSALARARGIYTVIDVAYKLLDNPVIVSDKSWKAIAIASDVRESDDAGFNEFLTQGALSLETVSINVRDRLTTRIEQSEGPFRYQGKDMKYARLFGKVIIGSRHAATVSIVELNRPFTDADYDTVSLLCCAVSAEMQKNKFLHYTRGLLYEELIVDLIEGRTKNESVISERIRSLDLGMKQFIFVLTIDIKGFDVEQFSLSYMRDYLEKLISGGKALIYNDHITLVTSCDTEDEPFGEDLAGLRGFLEEYNIKGGVSRGFTRLESLKEHYLHSLEALSLGTHLSSGKCLYFYDDYAVYHIAKTCAEAYELEVFRHPKLSLLREYDAEHNTSFTGSLYAYLKHGRNITDTAKALHLHRNSMIYHLKRIEEIMGLDLSDSDTLLHLELSFKFLEYEKLI